MKLCPISHAEDAHPFSGKFASLIRNNFIRHAPARPLVCGYLDSIFRAKSSFILCCIRQTGYYGLLACLKPNMHPCN